MLPGQDPAHEQVSSLEAEVPTSILLLRRSRGSDRVQVKKWMKRCCPIVTADRGKAGENTRPKRGTCNGCAL